MRNSPLSNSLIGALVEGLAFFMGLATLVYLAARSVLDE